MLFQAVQLLLLFSVKAANHLHGPLRVSFVTVTGQRCVAQDNRGGEDQQWNLRELAWRSLSPLVEKP